MKLRGGIAPRAVLYVGFTFLGLFLALVGLVDVLDVAGSRSRLGRDGSTVLWIHLFGEGSVTEILQWTALAIIALQMASASGRLPDRLQGESRFLVLVAIAAVLMLIEDAGNPSHRLAAYGSLLLNDDSYLIEVLFRLPVFLLVGGVPLYAFVRYWPSVARGRPGGRLMLGGLMAYGIAAASSVPANILVDFYPRAGRWITDRLFGGRLLRLEQTEAWQLRFDEGEFTGTLFMDYVYEESVELIGATLLLAGSLALSRHLREVARTGSSRPSMGRDATGLNGASARGSHPSGREAR